MGLNLDFMQLLIIHARCDIIESESFASLLSLRGDLMAFNQSAILRNLFYLVKIKASRDIWLAKIHQTMHQLKALKYNLKW